MSSTLTPFSFVVLTLVGRGGATAPQLAEMREQGRMYWQAPRSQWYAEPKRLAAAGLLSAQEEPGVTGPRVRYRLTDAGRDAIAAWVRTPAGLPLLKQEAVVRVLAADLADRPQDVLEGLAGLREELALVRRQTEAAVERAQGLGDRAPLLLAQHRMALRMVDALADWTDEVDALLR